MQTYLFSIDLEDVQLALPPAKRSPSHVAQLTKTYLHWLAGHGVHCTFFCVGELALAHPELLQEIQGAGHELALHGHRHIPLPQLGQDAFVKDLYANLEALHKAGAVAVRGFRAPVFSLTAHTPWAHKRLAEAGIRYSSSVLPVANPLHGWPGFGHYPKKMDGGVWELPMSTGKVGFGQVPIAGGTYLRLLPIWLAKKLFINAGPLVLGYVHPYDIDTGQERILHPGLEQKPWLNPLMYMGRSTLLQKLDALLATGCRVVPYGTYVQELELKN